MKHARKWTHTHTHTHTHSNNTCMHAHTCTYHAHSHMHTHTLTNTHLQTHTFTHTLNYYIKHAHVHAQAVHLVHQLETSQLSVSAILIQLENDIYQTLRRSSASEVHAVEFSRWIAGEHKYTHAHTHTHTHSSLHNTQNHTHKLRNSANVTCQCGDTPPLVTTKFLGKTNHLYLQHQAPSAAWS